MTIAARAPRGGLVETLAGRPYPLILRNAEIERFEDAHGGIFDAWDGFFGRAPKLRYRAVRDLVALGLVGGGLSDKDADALVESLGPDAALTLYNIAQALIGVAFLPDAQDAGGDPPEGPADPAGADPAAKKTVPGPGGSG
jgi:hypothetical protein